MKLHRKIVKKFGMMNEWVAHRLGIFSHRQLMFATRLVGWSMFPEDDTLWNVVSDWRKPYRSKATRASSLPQDTSKDETNTPQP